jgi:hypothetical protein
VDGTSFSKFLYKTSKKREIGHAWNLKPSGRQTFRFRKFSSWPFCKEWRGGGSPRGKSPRPWPREFVIRRLLWTEGSQVLFIRKMDEGLKRLFRVCHSITNPEYQGLGDKTTS